MIIRSTHTTSKSLKSPEDLVREHGIDPDTVEGLPQCPVLEAWWEQKGQYEVATWKQEGQYEVATWEIDHPLDKRLHQLTGSIGHYLSEPHRLLNKLRLQSAVKSVARKLEETR